MVLRFFFYCFFLVVAFATTAYAMFGQNMLLSQQVSPPPPPPPPPSAVLAAAQSVGFTSHVLGVDFTTVNAATWAANNITNCGASLSQPQVISSWTFTNRTWNAASNNPGYTPPCSDTAIVQDPDNSGVQALHYQLPIAEYPNLPVCNYPPVAFCNVYLAWPAYVGQSGSSNTAWLPTETYAKIVVRITHNSFFQPANNYGNGTLDWYSNSQFIGNYCDLDWSEVGTPPPGNEFYYSSIQCNTNVNITPGATSPNPLDITAYHTIEIINTSDESTTMEQCTWYDGVFANCFGGDPAVDAMTSHGMSMQLNIGWTGDQDTSHIPGNALEEYVKSFDIWTCPAYPGSCKGTIINHWPFP